MSDRICSNCQAVAPEAAVFCTSCGTRLAAPPTVNADDDATGIIPTGRGPADATAVIPTAPPPTAPDPAGSFDPNATAVGVVPPAPAGGEAPAPPHWSPAGPGQAPGYGQPSYPPPGHGQPSYPPAYGQPSYPPPAYGQPSYPPPGPAPGRSWPGQQPVGGPGPGQPWSSGAPAERTTGPARAAGIGAVVGGLAAIAGAFLPWASNAGRTFNGWEISNDAKADLGLGLAAVAIGVVLAVLARDRLAKLLRVAVGAIGVAVVVIAVVDLLDIQDKDADPEYGLFVLIASGIVLLISSVLPARRARR